MPFSFSSNDVMFDREFSLFYEPRETQRKLPVGAASSVNRYGRGATSRGVSARRTPDFRMQRKLTRHAV
eukprot:3989853-Pleurochrysis_carterae.AAC.1